MSFDKLNSFIVDKHFNQPCPSDSRAAPVLVLALHSIVGQPTTTLFRQNVCAGALKVKHFAIEGVVMWITTYGACASPHRLAGELEWRCPADLGKGAGLPDTLQACWGAGALLCTGSVAPEWVSQLHRFTFEGNPSVLWKALHCNAIWLVLQVNKFCLYFQSKQLSGDKRRSGSIFGNHLLVLVLPLKVQPLGPWSVRKAQRPGTLTLLLMPIAVTFLENDPGTVKWWLELTVSYPTCKHMFYRYIIMKCMCYLFVHCHCCIQIIVQHSNLVSYLYIAACRGYFPVVHQHKWELATRDQNCLDCCSLKIIHLFLFYKFDLVKHIYIIISCICPFLKPVDLLCQRLESRPPGTM